MRIPEFILFTKRERKVFYLLATILTTIYAANVLLKPKPERDIEYISLDEILVKDKSINIDKDKSINKAKKALNQYDDRQKKANEKYQKRKWKKPVITLTVFDPNTADSIQWISLGVHKYTVSNILKYRSKGGQFRSCQDLYKIYNMDSSYVATLLPYCKIDLSQLPAKKTYPKRVTTQKKKKKKKPRPLIDINTADTLALQSLYGIGPYLSGAIIKERERLGGFHSLTQLHDIYLFAPEILYDNKERITCSGIVRKFNINEANIDTLKSHKYINYKTAKSIIKYRNQHGPFNNINEIKNIITIKDSTYSKIEPYLRVE